MKFFILKRLLTLIPLLFGISLFVFLLLRLGDGNAALAYTRLSGLPPTEEMLNLAKIELGLNLPLWQQYFYWLWDAIQGDLGYSYVTQRPALQEIMTYMPATLQLTLTAMLITLLGSIVLGILGALYKDGIIDYIIRFISFSAVSMPTYWLGFLLMWLFAQQLQILPALGADDGFASLILPVCTLAFMPLGINARLVRASILEHMHSRHVIYMRSLNFSSWQIWLHIFRNSAIPILTALSMYFGELLGGAVIVESIFNWPGVGRYVISAIYNHDYPVIQAFTLSMVVIFLFINLFIDILCAITDPRIKLSQHKIKQS